MKKYPDYLQVTYPSGRSERVLLKSKKSYDQIVKKLRSAYGNDVKIFTKEQMETRDETNNY